MLSQCTQSDLTLAEATEACIRSDAGEKIYLAGHKFRQCGEDALPLEVRLLGTSL